MKRIVKASMKFNEDTILELLDEAVQAIQDECDNRGQDEYTDDMKWGSDRFEVPIFKFDGSLNLDPRPIEVFRFIYDPHDTHYSIEEQMHVQLDEFLQEWNRDDSEEITGEEYIEDLIDDLALEYLEKYRHIKPVAAIAKLIKRELIKQEYVEGEDFTIDDILDAMKGYDNYWD